MTIYVFCGRGGDIHQPQDTHLMPIYPSVSNKSNGYDYFRKAAEKFVGDSRFGITSPNKNIILFIKKDFEQNKLWSKNQQTTYRS